MKKTLLRTLLAGMLTLPMIQSAEVIIRTAPPAPRSLAVVGRAPSARHVWVPGYYKGVGGQYVWVAGSWMVPPRAGVVWVPVRWVQKPNGYLFIAGHWR
jgi:hypothetical protein